MTSENVLLLLIDDEPAIREVTKATLETTGNWAVVLASSGEEGLALAREVSPDLIVVDFMMPEWNGIETITEMREVDALKSVPIVVFSGWAIPDQAETIQRLGVACVIRKPYEPAALSAQLLKILADSRRGP